MDLFTQLPVVNYGGVNLLNILSKAVVIREHLSKYTVYYPYTIRDGERPDTIAHDYYGNSDYAWLVLIANNIMDPYYEWPLDYQQFHSYLQQKYGVGVVYELQSEISHYEYTGIGGQTRQEIERLSYQMSTTTYDALSAEDKSGWTPVYVYDYETKLNDDKRKIRLLSNAMTKQVNREIQELFNGR